MKYVLLIATALGLLAGCERSEANSSSSNGSIILDCSGDKQILAFKPDPKNPGTNEPYFNHIKTSYLIKFNNNGAQKLLYYYNASEQLFEPSECRNHTKCKLAVNSDIIEESGKTITNDNRVTWSVLTKINRRTGRMTIEHWNPSGSHFLTFEGTCTKGKIPAVQPQKF